MAKLSFSLFFATLALADAARVMQEVEVFPPAEKPVCPAGRRRLKSDSAKDSSPVAAPTDAPRSCITVTCGQTLVGPRTLDGNLGCSGFTTGDVALKLSGPNAVLDCAGFNIFAIGNKPVDGSIGIVLENGATAKNCNVEGFGTGAQVGAGDNTLASSTFFGNDIGVQTTGKGCNTITGVSASGNEESGFSIESTGTLVFENNMANGNKGNDNRDGGVAVFTPRDNKLEMVIEDFTAMKNNMEGFYVHSEDIDKRTAGNFRGMFYGKNYLLANNDDGIESNSKNAKIAIIGSVEAVGNAEGIDSNAGQIKLEETALVTSCDNVIDFRHENFVDKALTNVTCDMRTGTMDTVICENGCPTSSSVSAC